MPGRSGLEILPQLSAIAPRMKVLVVSALPGTASGPLALRANAFTYLENHSIRNRSTRASDPPQLRLPALPPTKGP